MRKRVRKGINKEWSDGNEKRPKCKREDVSEGREEEVKDLCEREEVVRCIKKRS